MRVIRSILVTSLVALVCASIAASVPATEIVRVWETDFGDPAEAARWHLLGDAHGLAQIEWEVVNLTGADGEPQGALSISLTGGLETLTGASIYRELPVDFRPECLECLVLEWEWNIADTELSDAVGLAIEFLDRAGQRTYLHWTINSHTRFTMYWSVFFDPSNEWVHHSVPLKGGLKPDVQLRDDQRLAVRIGSFMPVNQKITIRSIRIVEMSRPPESVAPLWGPRRIPVEHRFAPKRLESLRTAKAGALEDLDGDGLPELIALEHRGYLHLYRNDAGTYERNVTEDSGIVLPTFGTGAMLVDLDGDGDSDLVATSEYDVPRFFENRGDLRFSERSVLDDSHIAYWYGAAVDDLNGDGDPDVVAVGPGPGGFVWLRNDGPWQFTALDYQDLAGADAPLPDFIFGVTLGDLGGADRLPEVLLTPQTLLRNEGDRFAVDESVWPERDGLKTEGVLLADLSGDGSPDVLLLRDQAEIGSGPSRLFFNDGQGGLIDVTGWTGIPEFQSAEVALAEDFDNDGDLDLYICQNRYANLLLLNDGSGVFEDRTSSSSFIDAGGCDGAVAGDVDGDGGVDIVIFRHGSAPRVLRNRLTRGHWIGVRALSVRGPTEAIGARVEVRDATTGEAVLVRWVRRGRGFGSVGPAELRLGVGRLRRVDVNVEYPSGRSRVLENVATSSSLVVRESDGTSMGLLRARVSERLGTWRAQVFRALHSRPALPWLITVSGLVLGGLMVVPGWPRRIGVIGLVLGATLVVPLGSAPGRGIDGSPAWQWLVGSAIGIGIPWGASAGRRAVRRLRHSNRRRAVSLEELFRRAEDFRHAGVETRTLLSIHNRVENLFLDESPHPRFVEDLATLGQRFRETTGPNIRALAEFVDDALPGRRLTEALRDDTGILDQLLRTLPGPEAEPEQSAAWRRAALPVVRRLREEIPRLLASVEQACAIDPLSVIEESIGLHEHSLHAAGVRVVVSNRGERGARRLVVSRSDLLTVLDNLMRNALRAMMRVDHRRIDITIEPGEDHVGIRFRDTGPGVAPGLEAQIFQYGFTTDPRGNGYGLARSREILAHYGGSIALERRSGASGATFLILLRRPSGSSDSSSARPDAAGIV